jgi:hypothetical protein
MDWSHLAHCTDQGRAVVETVINFGSIKSSKFLDQPRNYYLVKKDSAP